MNREHALSTSVVLAAVLGLGLASAACAAPSVAEEESTEESTSSTAAPLMRGTSLGLDGDSCTVRIKPDGTKVPGTEKDGDCCSNADPKDCVVILKPFPGSFTWSAF